MQHESEMQKSRGVKTGADGQQKSGNHSESGALEDQHGREGGGRQAGLDVAAGEEDGRRSQAEEKHRLVGQVFVFKHSSG